MKPEKGRISLEDMDDVEIAVSAILLYRRTLPDDETLRISLAESSDNLPILLSKNKTHEVINGLTASADNGLELYSLTPEVAGEWLAKLDGVEIAPLTPQTVAETPLYEEVD